MGYRDIPLELQLLRQWNNWRSETVTNKQDKPTKVPYNPLTGQKCSSIDPFHWIDFETALNAAPQFSGIGFVLSEADPYCFVDLDKSDDPIISARHNMIAEFLNSYSEISPNGGLHIIVKAKVPHGRKRHSVEIYSSQRYMTMTGNIYKNLPIADRQKEIEQLYDEMGTVGTVRNFDSQPVTKTNEQILIEGASAPHNGEKFKALWEGKWQSVLDENGVPYPSQSEADQAFVNMLCMLSKNRDQIREIFQSSWIGSRKKAKRLDYVYRMIDKGYDREIPEAAFENLRAYNRDWKNAAPSRLVGQGTNGAASLAIQPEETGRDDASLAPIPNGVKLPPGLIGDVAWFVYDQSQLPVQEIALCASLALLAGICGRQYKTPTHAGLNLYTVLVGKTGTGKEAMSRGLNRLMSAIEKTVPAASEFLGPATFASGPALHRLLIKKKSCLSISNEFGHQIQNMCSERAPHHLVSLRQFLLTIFTKSDSGQILRGSDYADKDLNIESIIEPALTTNTDTTSSFFNHIDERQIEMGLIPRLLIIEYHGDTVDENKNPKIIPNGSLVTRLAELANHVLTQTNQNFFSTVQFNSDSQALDNAFNDYCVAKMRGQDNEAIRSLWSRTRLMAMKVASLLAIGQSFYNPIISTADYEWSKDLLIRCTDNMVSKITSDKLGKIKTAPQQMELVKREIIQFSKNVLGPRKIGKYRMNEAMINDEIIPLKYWNDKLLGKPQFNPEHGLQGSAAIQIALKTAVGLGWLREIKSTQETIAKYQTQGQLWQIMELPT